MALHAELEADAQRVLTEAGMPWLQVIAVHGDAILYENALHRARTCWLYRQKDNQLKVRMVEGFPAWPPEHWHE